MSRGVYSSAAIATCEPFCEISRNTTQSIPFGTITPIQFTGPTSVAADPWNLFESGFIRLPVRGLYHVIVEVTWGVIAAPAADARLEVQAFNTGTQGLFGGHVAWDSRSVFAHANYIRTFSAPGYFLYDAASPRWIGAYVVQTALSPATLNAATLTIVRVADTSAVEFGFAP